MPTVDWTTHRSHERYRFYRVDWDSWTEVEDLAKMERCSWELSAFSTARARAEIDLCGKVPSCRDLIRIYYVFEDAYGTEQASCIGTFVVNATSPNLEANYTSDGNIYVDWTGKPVPLVTGSVKCTSVLQVLADKQYGMPYTVPAGTHAIAKAAEMIRELGLRCEIMKASDYEIASDHVFEPDDSYLTIVNWLLGVAGFASARVDAYGHVLLTPYIEPHERSSVWVLEDNASSIIEPVVQPTNNLMESPNVVRLLYVADDETIWASASNVTQGMLGSLDYTSRERTYFEQVDELAGSTPEERLNNIQDLAERRLKDKVSQLEYLTFKCAYVPIREDDNITVNLKGAGLNWSGTVTNISSANASAPYLQVSARRFVRRDITIEKDGGLL